MGHFDRMFNPAGRQRQCISAEVHPTIGMHVGVRSLVGAVVSTVHMDGTARPSIGPKRCHGLPQREDTRSRRWLSCIHAGMPFICQNKCNICMSMYTYHRLVYISIYIYR